MIFSGRRAARTAVTRCMKLGAGLLVLDVAEAVANFVHDGGPAGPGSRRPVGLPVPIAQIKRLGVRIADRVVAPVRQPILAAVDGPGAAGASFGGDEPRLRIGDDVVQGSGGKRQAAVGIRTQADDILVARGRKPADAVVEMQRFGAASRCRCGAVDFGVPAAIARECATIGVGQARWPNVRRLLVRAESRRGRRDVGAKTSRRLPRAASGTSTRRSSRSHSDSSSRGESRKRWSAFIRGQKKARRRLAIGSSTGPPSRTGRHARRNAAGLRRRRPRPMKCRAARLKLDAAHRRPPSMLSDPMAADENRLRGSRRRRRARISCRIGQDLAFRRTASRTPGGPRRPPRLAAPTPGRKSTRSAAGDRCSLVSVQRRNSTSVSAQTQTSISSRMPRSARRNDAAQAWASTLVLVCGTRRSAESLPTRTRRRRDRGR